MEPAEKNRATELYQADGALNFSFQRTVWLKKCFKNIFKPRGTYSVETISNQKKVFWFDIFALLFDFISH